MTAKLCVFGIRIRYSTNSKFIIRFRQMRIFFTLVTSLQSCYCVFAETVVGESVVVIKKLLQMQVWKPFHILSLKHTYFFLHDDTGCTEAIISVLESLKMFFVKPDSGSFERLELNMPRVVYHICDWESEGIFINNLW